MDGEHLSLRRMHGNAGDIAVNCDELNRRIVKAITEGVLPKTKNCLIKCLGENCPAFVSGTKVNMVDPDGTQKEVLATGMPLVPENANDFEVPCYRRVTSN